ncbi:TfoX/Sxy family protein [Aureibaculum sp. 2210JD6-5]|uniref:TfoX/Sxy family protein n=1 Tax=Aureibaculum sp. 2210JD6-5 TaxID=3103957 RepID=UPI002AADAC1E|nr:TfoX/Sxy family protein [Aureibaculum sp. 2210JD6-5]MDY7395464.1 TfoX/Sxy family protein [Aureibaculum sp. 2210JD6-5]
MPYNTNLADKIRAYLVNFPNLAIEEKKMFGGLAFLVNGKMCVNVSKDRIMCRFDPNLEEEIAEKTGYEPMIMKGKTLKGYCYVHPEGFRNQEDFENWVNWCLDFNKKAKSSKK